MRIASNWKTDRCILYALVLCCFWVYSTKSKRGGYYRNKIAVIIKKYTVYSLVLLVVWLFFELITSQINGADITHKCIGILYSRYYLYPTHSQTNIAFLDMNEVCNGPLWFLTAYVTTMFVYSQVNIIIKKTGRKYLIIAFLLILHMLCSSLPILLPWSLDSAFVGALFMLVGKELRMSGFPEKRWSLVISTIIAVLFVCLAEINGATNMSTRSWGEHGILSSFLFLITGIMGSILLLRLCYELRNTLICKYVAVIGRNTLPLLGFHLVLLKYFPLITIKGDRFSYISNLLDVVIIIVIITCISEINRKCRVQFLTRMEK